MTNGSNLKPTVAKFATVKMEGGRYVVRQVEQIDFLIRREQPITEQLFSTGCVWDAYTFVSDLVRSATTRLILIDPFVDERTLLLLDKRSGGVGCTVHTRYSAQT